MGSYVKRMDWLLYVIGAFLVVGVVLAIYEKRKGLRVRDERKRAAANEIDRDLERAKDAFRIDR